MADSKRNSVGGNRSGSSTPKPNAAQKGPAATGPGELEFGKIIGARIRITMTNSASPIEGTIYTACPITNILVISGTSSSASATQPEAYTFMPVSRIQSFNILSLPSSPVASVGAVFENAQPPTARIDLKAMKAREEAAVRKIKEQDAMKGKGVTKEAQDIFDGLAKTLPARWHETQIVVNDAVIIKAPYRPEDCTAPNHQANNLIRVKKVLENERRKISQRTGSVTPAAKAQNTKASAPSVGVGAGRGTPAVATPVLPSKGG